MNATRSRLIVTGFLLLLLGACEGSGSSGLISGSSELRLPNEEIGTGGSLRSLLLVDLNNDGVPDLVTVPVNQKHLSVVFGGTRGPYTSDPLFLAFDGIPRAVAVGDMNGDGNLDLVAAGEPDGGTDPGIVVLLLGRRDGSFRPGARIFVPLVPKANVVTDLNQDGSLDIILLHDRSDELSVLEGRGDGTFEEPALVHGRSTAVPFSLAVGDLDQDGYPDLVTTNSDHEVMVRLGTGDLVHCRITGVDPKAVAIADVDSDGIPDILTANEGSADVSLLFGIGDGSLKGCSLDEPRLLVGNVPSAIAVEDVDSDGLLDVVTANRQSDTVSVLLAKGGTRDDLFREQLVLEAGGFPSVLAVADVDGDEIVDIVTGDETLANATVLFGLGNGTFLTQGRPAIGSDSRPLSMPIDLATADLNGDGTLDLVTANHESNDVSLLLNRGDGSFCLEGRLAVGTLPIALALDDLDKDGLPDLTVVNRGSGEIIVLLGRNEASGSDPIGCNDLPPPVFRLTTGSREAAQSYQLTGIATALVVFDVDSDGTLDLVVSATGSKAGEAGTISVLRGNGDGTFVAKPPVEVGGSPISVSAGHLNGDEFPDLATADRELDSVSIFLGSSSGRFVLDSTQAVGSRPTSVVVTDLNEDGIDDLAVANSGSDDLSVLFNRGDGSFSSPQDPLLVGSTPTFLDVADANADGLLDLVVVNENSYDVSILLGRGDGRFAKQRLFRTDVQPRAVVVAHFNIDGSPDLAVANREGVLARRGAAVGAGSATGFGTISTLIADMPMVSTTDSESR